MDKGSKERRDGCRIARREALSVELRVADSEDSASVQVVAAETVDVSVDGLRMILPRPVSPECLFEICVEVKGDPRPFLLTGESRWCRPVGDQGLYEAGFRIHDGVGTDYRAWAALLSEAAPKPSA
ncbi:MAG: PilZ domain-containing protein [Chromatiales bacterium]|jgi:hypothetical protein